MANDIEKTESLPKPDRTDQLYRRVNQLTRGANPREHDECPAIVAELEALSRPATKAEIATKLSIMLHAFPNAGNADREAFVRTLADDVGASQPSIGVLDLACRYVRRNARFIPTINEVLQALAAAASEREKIFYILGKKGARLECAAAEMFEDPDQRNQGF
jgi:hypothetical protein